MSKVLNNSVLPDSLLLIVKQSLQPGKVVCLSDREFRR